MGDNKVFIWMAEEMLKSAFLDWVKKNKHTGISYPTLARAQVRQFKKEPLTARQLKAEKLALEFKREYMSTQAQAA